MEMNVFYHNGSMCVSSKEAAELLEVRHGNLIMLIQKLVKNHAELQTEFRTEMNGNKVLRICMTEKGCKAVADFKMNNVQANKPATQQFILAYQRAFGQVQETEVEAEGQAEEVQAENSAPAVAEMLLAEDDASQTVIINDIELFVKEYNGQRVVTLNDIDAVHHRPEGTARRNFNYNKKHLIENEDYFELTRPDDIRTFGLVRPQGGTPEKLILFTESGYYLLVKAFTDDLSWDVQRKLKKGYFLAKQLVQQLTVPDSYMIEDSLERAKRWMEEEKERRALQSRVAEQTKLLAVQNERIEEQEKQIAEMKPQSDYYNQILNAKGLLTTTQIAKDYGKSARWLNEYLHKKKIQFKQNGVWHLYQNHAGNGYAMTKTTVRPDRNGIEREHINTYWTPKGRVFIYEVLKADGIYPVSEQEGQLALTNA